VLGICYGMQLMTHALGGEVAAAPHREFGLATIRVEPDGSVYPARGEMTAGGNLLIENWQTIWNREIFRRYRQRIETPTRCDVCPGLEICAADCPGDPRGWAAGKD